MERLVTARLSLTPLLGLIIILLTAATPRDGEAAPIVYRFAGEMTGFTPPVSRPGPPVPVPSDLRFFTGGFDYDAAASGGAVSDFHLSFTGGPDVTVVPQTEYRTEARIFEDLFLFALGVRKVSVGGSFPDSLVSFLFERPLTPQDAAGVLPPDLDGFTGSFIGASLPGGSDVRGALSEFAREASVIPEPPMAMLIGSALSIWLLTRLRRTPPGARSSQGEDQLVAGRPAT
jgi:hypothetical protein